MEIIPVLNKNQIETAAKIADEIWREHYITIISAEQIDYMLKNFQSAKAIEKQISEQNYMYFLAKGSKDHFDGYFAVVPEKEELLLSKLYIRKESRGRGYARQIVDFIRNLARSMNLKKITLTVNRNNAGSIKAYEKIGFKITGEVNLDIGGGFFMNDYKMSLEV